MTPEIAALYILYAGAALLAVVAAGALLMVVGGFLLGALEAMTERAEQTERRPPPPPGKAVPRESLDKPAEPWVPPSKRENNPEHYTLGTDRDGEDPYQF